MNQFIAFTKKEFYESVATFRLYILFAVFLVLGMLSPLMAKLTPEILEMLGDMGTGIAIQMPEPTMMDAWGQFFKKLSQIGMLALVIVFGGLMSNELSKGSLTNLLTKGLNRHTVIFSKFFSASVLWICSYLLCFGVCYAYTAYFWEIGTMGHALLAFAAPWLFGEFMLALLIFSGSE
jgi:ABC-2 type transport system permease protein